nr:MAG TPA: hypothetical protein [Caudoviricetes sp.]DAG48558.1 MAG TPA: hypothetical protein [Caudoviricetes sp.]
MNEEILKEAVVYGDYIGYHWKQYTFEQLEKRMRELCGACQHALGKIEKNHITDFERGSWLLIQSRIILKLESVDTVEMIKTANFSKQKMIELEKDSGGQYLKEVETFIKIFMED